MIAHEGGRVWKAVGRPRHLCVSSNDSFTSYRLSGILWPSSPFAASQLDLCRTGLALGGMRGNDGRYEPSRLSFYVPRYSSHEFRHFGLAVYHYEKGVIGPLRPVFRHSVPGLCVCPRFRKPVRAFSCLVDRWTRAPFHVSRTHRGACELISAHMCVPHRTPFNTALISPTLRHSQMTPFR